MFKKDIYNKTGMLMGLISSLLTFIALWIVFEYSTYPFERFGFFSISIPVASIFITAMYFRGIKIELPLSFVQVLRMSWWNLLITAILFSSFYAFYITSNEVSFMDKYLTFYESFIRTLKFLMRTLKLLRSY